MTSRIINLLLGLAKYSVLARTDGLTLLMTYSVTSAINCLLSCHDFVSTICSNNTVMEAIFLGIRFCIDQRWYSYYCYLNSFLCFSFDWYNSILLSWTRFFKAVFTFFDVGFHSASIGSPCIISKSLLPLAP